MEAQKPPKRRFKPERSEGYQKLIERYAQAALGGNSTEVSQVVDEALALFGSAMDVSLKIIAPAQSRFGDLWESGDIGIAEEHGATQISLEQIQRLRSFLKPKKDLPFRVVITSLGQESHFLGARIFADMLYEAGWKVHFLGERTPAQSLTDYIQQRLPDLVSISITLDSSLDDCRSLLTAFQGKQSRPKFLLGGQAAVKHFASFSELPVDGVASSLEEGRALAEQMFVEQLDERLESGRVLHYCGRVLAEQRRLKNLTQGELASIAQLDRGYLSAIEQGKQNISVAALARLCSALGLSLRDVFPE